MPTLTTPRRRLVHSAAVIVTTVALVSCGSKAADSPPPTISPAQAAVSPAAADAPAGSVRPLAGRGEAVVFDAATSSSVVLSSAAGGGSALVTFPLTGPSRTVALPSHATAIVGDGSGTVYAATKGGYFAVDLRAGDAVATFDVDGEPDTDFTAITRLADGKIVLGSASGAVYTLSSATAVGAPRAWVWERAKRRKDTNAFGMTERIAADPDS